MTSRRNRACRRDRACPVPTAYPKNKISNMNNNKIILLIIPILIMSCNPLIKTYYGIKKPKIENKRSLTQYLNRKKINTGNVYAVDYEDYKNIINKIKGVPEILIFDKKGRAIQYRNEEECNAEAFDFIEKLSVNDKFIYDDSINLKQYLSMLKDLDGKKAYIPLENKADFYLFIFWAKYTGRLNKNHIKVWEEQAFKNKNSHIQVIKVNVDEMDWWHKSSFINR